jgi:hypothetical protein
MQHSTAALACCDFALCAQVEMSSYLKYDLKVSPMVTNGNEGKKNCLNEKKLIGC